MCEREKEREGGREEEKLIIKYTKNRIILIINKK